MTKLRNVKWAYSYMEVCMHSHQPSLVPLCKVFLPEAILFWVGVNAVRDLRCNPKKWILVLLKGVVSNCLRVNCGALCRWCELLQYKNILCCMWKHIVLHSASLQTHIHSRRCACEWMNDNLMYKYELGYICFTIILVLKWFKVESHHRRTSSVLHSPSWKYLPMLHK